jgi:hypothetical protein
VVSSVFPIQVTRSGCRRHGTEIRVTARLPRYTASLRIQANWLQRGTRFSSVSLYHNGQVAPTGSRVGSQPYGTCAYMEVVLAAHGPRDGWCKSRRAKVGVA